MVQADGTIYINTAINANGMKPGGKAVEAAARRMAREVSNVGLAAKLALREQTNAFIAENRQYAQQEQKVNSLKSKIAELRNQKVPTDKFKGLSEQIEKNKHYLNDLLTTQERFLNMGGDEKSSYYKKLVEEIEQLRTNIRNAKTEQEKLIKSGKAYTGRTVDGTKTKEYKEALKELGTEQEKLIKSGNKLGSSYIKLKQKTDSYKKSQIQLSSINKSVNKTLHKMSILLKKGAVSMLGLNKQTKKSKNTFGKTLKTILKYTLGIRSMYILVNKIRNAIKQGFSNLAQYSDETNKNISALMSALTQLKNSLATAFNPILTVVTPALTKFINMISQAATYVGMFIAAMTGQKSFVKAIAVQEDYAASLKDTKDKAEDAKKATDSYLSGLDEVKRFETKDKDEDEGYKPPTPQEMFETVPIEQSIANMVQKIKDLIKTEDWEGLGAYMASGINAGLQKVYDVINWDNVGPKITYFINAFTKSFNSLVEHIEWDLMGRVLGAGLNTLVNSFNLLVGPGGIDFEKIGEKLSVGLRGLVDEIHWVEFGKALGNKFMIGWRIFDGFVTDMWRKNDAGLTGWQELGKSLADGINGVIESIDLVKILSSLSAFAIGILEMLSIAIENARWEQIGQDIADSIRAVEWKRIAEGLFDVGLELINGLLKAFEKLPKPVQVAIAVLGSFFAVLKSLIFITNIIKGINSFKIMLKALTSPIGLVVLAIGSLIAIGVLLIANWDKVKKAAKETWDFVKQKFEEFGTWVSGVFSTDWEIWFGVFGSVINGFLKNVENIWKGIREIFSGIITFISGVFTGNWKKAWEGVKQIFKGVFDTLVGIAKIPLNDIIGFINRLISAIVFGINAVISALNKIKIKVPDWVPKLGGKSFGFNLQKVSTPRIPYLASGAVIPPNAPFLAMMGDQKHGTNLEAPESLIRKIVREEAGRNQQNGGTTVVKLYLDGKQIAEAVVKQGKIEQTASGKNMFALG